MAIAIKKVIVPRFHRLIHTGQVVDMSVEIVNNQEEWSQLADAGVVTATLFNPVGTKLLSEEPMIPVALGVFGTSYQTRPNSLRGVYTATFNAQFENQYARIDRISVFKVIKLSEFETFTVQGVTDQNGNLWYWYIDDAELLVVSPTFPDFINLLAEPIEGVFSWINLEGKYIYPMLDGQPDVSLTQPGVGTGVDASPEFIGTNMNTYVLEVNQANEILVVET